MAVFSLGTSATDKLFLEYIYKGVELLLRNNTTVYDRFKTDTQSCKGKYGIMKLNTSVPKSARPSSTSTFPTATQGEYDEFKFYMKRGMYASLQFDGLAIACGKGDDAAAKDIIKTETEGIMFYIADRLNKQYWGDGSGRLAQMSAAVSTPGVTAYVDGPWHGQDTNEYTPPSAYLAEGQSVDIRDDTSPYTIEAEEVTISAISEGGAGTDTLTFAENITCTDNAYILDHDTYAAADAAGTGVPVGLYAIINTANQTIGMTSTNYFQGINRSNVTNAQAQLFNMGSAAVTNKKVLEVIQKCEKWGTIDVILTNSALWRNWAEILYGDKTMPDNPQVWGGVSGMDFYGGKGKNRKIPIIWDDDCPDQRIYFIDDSTIKISAPTTNGMAWRRGDGGRVLVAIQGKDEFGCNLVHYYNMTCRNPRANGCLYGVTHTES